MKIKEVTQLDAKDLVKKIEAKKQEIFKITTQMRLGKVQNLHSVKYLRKDLAQLYTVLQDKITELES